MTNKIDKDYWICEGCGERVHSLIETKDGMRCLKCVINNNLTFLSDVKGYLKYWVSNAEWKDEEGNKITTLK